MKRQACVFTITRNEPFYLHLWLQYYCSQFDQQDVYVIDNSSTDGSIEEARQKWPGINVIDQPTVDAFNNQWLLRIVRQRQRMLLDTYDVVVYAETDEFLIPHDADVSLRDYLRWFAESDKLHVKATGWNVVHQHATERPLCVDVEPHVLSDRGSMWLLPSYNKTLVSKVALDYTLGFHTVMYRGRRDLSQPDGTLDLLHAWMIDVDLYCQRHAARLKLQLASMPHGSSDEAAVKEFFETHVPPWDKDAYLASVRRNGHAMHAGEQHAVPGHWKRLIVW